MFNKLCTHDVDVPASPPSLMMLHTSIYTDDVTLSITHIIPHSILQLAEGYKIILTHVADSVVRYIATYLPHVATGYLSYKFYTQLVDSQNTCHFVLLLKSWHPDVVDAIHRNKCLCNRCSYIPSVFVLCSLLCCFDFSGQKPLSSSSSIVRP